MNVVVAAPRSSLASYVARCESALGATPHTVTPFAHDESRDPTIDLPHLAFTLKPQLLVLVAPRREDPATLDAVRRFGAASIVWFEPLDARDGRAAAARRRWVAGAADAVIASDADTAAGLVDRNGKLAIVAAEDAVAEVLRAWLPARPM